MPMPITKDSYEACAELEALNEIILEYHHVKATRETTEAMKTRVLPFLGSQYARVKLSARKTLLSLDGYIQGLEAEEKKKKKKQKKKKKTGAGEGSAESLSTTNILSELTSELTTTPANANETKNESVELSSQPIVTSLFTPVSATENTPLSILKKIKEIAYGTADQSQIKTLRADIEKLKNISRDAAFWQCIYSGFLMGKGESFFKTLENCGAYKILFPPTTELTEECEQKNSEWLQARLEAFDSVYEPFIKHETKLIRVTELDIAAMLIAKDLSADSSKDKRQDVYNQYQIHWNYEVIGAKINNLLNERFSLTQSGTNSPNSKKSWGDSDSDSDLSPSPRR